MDYSTHVSKDAAGPGALLQLVRVPNRPDYVEGVINLRGKVIPVIALRCRLGMEAAAPDKNTRVVVVDVREQTLGFIVDAVSEVLRIRADTVQPTPRISSVEREYISGSLSLPDSADSQPHTFRENAHFTGTSRIRLVHRLPQSQQPIDSVRLLTGHQ